MRALQRQLAVKIAAEVPIWMAHVPDGGPLRTLLNGPESVFKEAKKKFSKVVKGFVMSCMEQLCSQEQIKRMEKVIWIHIEDGVTLVYLEASSDDD